MWVEKIPKAQQNTEKMTDKKHNNAQIYRGDFVLISRLFLVLWDILSGQDSKVLTIWVER